MVPFERAAADAGFQNTASLVEVRADGPGKTTGQSRVEEVRAALALAVPGADVRVLYAVAETEANVVLNNPMQPASREQELIGRVQRGENELFYELVKPYERRVYAAALAILRNDADAEDVAQEAMLKALRGIRQFRAEARFSTWLIQITVNEALMRRRRERWQASRLSSATRCGAGRSRWFR